MNMEQQVFITCPSNWGNGLGPRAGRTSKQNVWYLEAKMTWFLSSLVVFMPPVGIGNFDLEGKKDDLVLYLKYCIFCAAWLRIGSKSKPMEIPD